MSDSYVANGSHDKVRKTRVSKACNFCRRRKIKCDGEMPCSNCTHSENRNCEYPLTPRKPRQRKPDLNKSVELLEKRLGNLESILMRLTSKLDPSIGPVGNNYAAEASESSSSEASENDYMDSERPDDNHLTATSMSDPKHPDSVPDSRLEEKVIYMDQYFGAHSLFHIFSQNSIDWMNSLLGPEEHEYLAPLENIVQVFKLCKDPPPHVWDTNPKVEYEQLLKLRRGELIEDHQLVLDLLDNYDSIFLVGYFCRIEDIKTLFAKHYASSDVRKEPNMPELLLMNAALLVCISREQDVRIQCRQGRMKRTPGPALEKLSLLDLQRMHDRYSVYSLFYYSKVAMFSDGIMAIQGMLLLMMYIETRWTKPKTNYIIISTAVRLAQGVGLHRYESFEFLSDSEISQRRRIWWFCQYFDMELSYRTGRPPSVNYDDVSTYSDADFGANAIGGTPEFCSCTDWARMTEMVAQSPQEILYHYTSHYLMKVTKIRAKSYNILYSASAEHKSFFTILKALTTLNQEMMDIADSMPIVIRPMFYDDPYFESRCKEFLLNLNDTSRDNFLTSQFTFFIHLMTINRLPFQIDYPDHDPLGPESLKFRELQMKSARTILHLAGKLDKTKATPSCIKWLLYYPFAAYMNMIRACLHRPTHMETYLDVKLLIEVSMEYFRYFNVNDDLGYDRFEPLSREAATDGLIRILLRIVLRYFEKTNSCNLTGTIKGLQAHLDDALKQFPDMRSAEHTEVFRFIFGEDRLNRDAQSAKESVSTNNSFDEALPTKNELVANQVPNFAELFGNNANSSLFESYSPLNNLPNFFFDNNLG